jgi:hypothetical protein
MTSAISADCRPLSSLLAGPEKAGGGGSIPSLATIYNQQVRPRAPNLCDAISQPFVINKENIESIDVRVLFPSTKRRFWNNAIPLDKCATCHVHEPCKDDHLGICSPEARLDVTFPGLVALARPIGENVDDWMTTERDRSITRYFVIQHRGIQRTFFEA